MIDAIWAAYGPDQDPDVIVMGDSADGDAFVRFTLGGYRLVCMLDERIADQIDAIDALDDNAVLKPFHFTIDLDKAEIAGRRRV